MSVELQLHDNLETVWPCFLQYGESWSVERERAEMQEGPAGVSCLVTGLWPRTKKGTVVGERMLEGAGLTRLQLWALYLKGFVCKMTADESWTLTAQ